MRNWKCFFNLHDYQTVYAGPEKQAINLKKLMCSRCGHIKRVEVVVRDLDTGEYRKFDKIKDRDYIKQYEERHKRI